MLKNGWKVLKLVLVVLLVLFGSKVSYAERGVTRLFIEGHRKSSSNDSMVKIGWTFKVAPPAEFLGFNLKRKNLAEDSEWVQLNDQLLEFRTDGLIDLTKRGLTVGQKSSVQQFMESDQYKKKTKKMTPKEALDKVINSQPVNLSMTGQYFAVDFTRYIVNGCGFIDQTALEGEDYLYGLFMVTEGVGEENEPDSTAFASWLNLTDPDFCQGFFKSFRPTYNENTESFMLFAVINPDIAEHLQVCRVKVYKGKPGSEVKCSTQVFRHDLVRTQIDWPFSDSTFDPTKPTLYRFEFITWLGTKLPSIEYTVDIQQQQDEAKAKKQKVKDRGKKYKTDRSVEEKILTLNRIKHRPFITTVSWKVDSESILGVDHFVIKGRQIDYLGMTDYDTPFSVVQGHIPSDLRSWSISDPVDAGFWEYQIEGVSKEGNTEVASNIQPFVAQDFSLYPPVPTGLDIVSLEVKHNMLHVSLRWDEKDPEDTKTIGYRVYIDYNPKRVQPVRIGRDGTIEGNEYTYVIESPIKEERDCTVYLTAVGLGKNGRKLETEKELVTVPFHTKAVMLLRMSKTPKLMQDKVNKVATINWEYEDLGNLKGFRFYEQYSQSLSSDCEEEKMIADTTEISSSLRSFSFPMPDESKKGCYTYYIVPVSIYNTVPQVSRWEAVRIIYQSE